MHRVMVAVPDILKSLTERLIKDFGKGFDYSNLKNMRQFYLVFPIGDALRSELSWTHYRLLMRVEKEAARDFYLEECINSNWSTRELERQICSLLFERLALSRDKKGVLELAKKGHHITAPSDSSGYRTDADVSELLQKDSNDRG